MGGSWQLRSTNHPHSKSRKMGFLSSADWVCVMEIDWLLPSVRGGGGFVDPERGGEETG